MRRIIVSMNVTLNGFMAGPNGELDWHLQNWTGDMNQILAEQLSHADTILLGRHTYGAMACYWPAAGIGVSLSRDDLAYADMMNSYPKVVCSTTLRKAAWNNSQIISKNIRTELLKLKGRAGKDIMVYGSAGLVQYLTKHNLADEYLLWVYPITLQKGIALFKKKQNLKLLSVRPLQSGVVILRYRAGN
jgi:dihydrofolate reductase